MSGNFRRFLCLSLALVVVSLILVGDSSAAGDFAVTLSAPDITDFPRLVARLDVNDPSGAFIHGLKPQDVSLLEDGVLVPVTDLQQQKPGVQLVIAITPGDTFGIRDGQGITRYEYLLQDLLAGAWAVQPPGGDDFSLLTRGGPQLIHAPDPSSLHTALAAYLPEPTDDIPNLEVLAAALQVASDPPSRPGMERAILFITPPQPPEVSLGLQSIISSANQQDIHIFVWVLTSYDTFELPIMDQLRNLADQTRGAFFTFSYDEPVPDLEALLEPLRYVYQLGYTSQVATAGSHQVVAQVMAGSQQLSSLPQTFEVDLQAPLPSLLSLPAEIARTFSASVTPGAASLETDLTPNQQLVQIEIAFPDGYDRPLARTSLYVDGALYAENIAPPFDQFTWDLRLYTQDGTHTLSVAVVDELGLTGTSSETSVRITVPTTTQGVMVVFSQKRTLLVGVIVLMSASILVLVLILGGRIRPKPHPGQVIRLAGSTDKTRPAGYRQRMRQQKDPVTQPVKIVSHLPVQAKPSPKRRLIQLPWFKRKALPAPAVALLFPLAGPDEVTLPAPLKIQSDNVALGSDASRASLVINDPSVEAMHARITHAGNTFLITDCGSIAGTWVNYDPIPPEGKSLEHADIIHLGQVGFRFNLAEPGPPRRIEVTILENEP